MTTEQLVAAIAAILPSVGDPPDIHDYDPESADFQLPRRHRVGVGDEQLARLASEVRKIDSLARLEGGVFHYSPGAQGSPIRMEAFAQWLLAQARFRAPHACVAELMELVRRNSSPVMEIVPIWGISPLRRIDLSYGLAIVPIADLPPSRLKDLLTGKRRHKFSFDVANSSPRPGAAIIREFDSGPLYEPANSESALISPEQLRLALTALLGPSEEDKRTAIERLAATVTPRARARSGHSAAELSEELSAVIALKTPKPVFPLGHWYQRPRDIPLVGPLGGWSGPTNEHPFYIPVEPQEYAYEEIEQLVRRFQALDAAMRKRLRAPLSRLNQSRRNLDHHTVEDAAIDLGIALEAMLTFDRDHNAPISYLLRLRGALLIGGDANGRSKTFRELRDAYDVRSKVVHSGMIADLREVAESQQARENLECARARVKAGHALCSELAVKLIESGRFPDWDSLLLGSR